MKRRFEYKCVRIKYFAQDTELMLNTLAGLGWELVCSYARYNDWLILKREVKE